MTYPCSGVILAGGLSSRFSGKDKAFLQLGDSTLLDRLYGIFKDLFQEIILVTNNPPRYLRWDLNIVTDILPVRSSLTGIHAGLFYATRPHVFVVACDNPFLKADLVRAILDAIDPRFDAIIPETASGMEPLCAVYSKNCLAAVERQLLRNRFKIQRVFKKNRIKTLSEKFCRQADPDLLSFFNINTPEDHSRAQKRLKEFL